MSRNARKRLLLYPIALLLLAGLCYAGFVYKAPPDVSTLVHSAEAMARVGLYDEAIRNANRALEQDPHNRYAHIILGYSYDRKGEVQPALAHYEQAIDLTASGDDTLGLLHLYHADVLTKAGHPSDGLKEARAVSAKNPSDVQAHYVAGRALRKLGRPMEAVKEYRAAARAAPKNADPLVLEGEVAREQKDLAGAKQLFGRALTLAPKNVEIHMRMARVHALLGEKDAAVEEIVAAAGIRRATARKWLDSMTELSGLAGTARVRQALGTRQ